MLTNHVILLMFTPVFNAFWEDYDIAKFSPMMFFFVKFQLLSAVCTGKVTLMLYSKHCVEVSDGYIYLSLLARAVIQRSHWKPPRLRVGFLGDYSICLRWCDCQGKRCDH